MWFWHRGFLNIIGTDVGVAERHIVQILKEQNREAHSTMGDMERRQELQSGAC